uniref:transposase n=1 Tax=unclassified Streptomyces TaxID=2593676 RepID=UPI003C7CDE64
MLYNDIAWRLLPQELGFGSRQTCWRQLDRWQKVGVFDQLHRVLLAELNAAGELDWSRACVDGFHIRAKKECRHRPVAGRPSQDRQQAPLDLRRTRHPAQGHHDRCPRTPPSAPPSTEIRAPVGSRPGA